MSRIRTLPPQARSTYDPNRAKVILAPDASEYAKAHESAHREQQKLETRAWQAHRRCMHTPWLCRWTRVWIEAEAARMALRSMRKAGTWTKEARREARTGTWSYVTCLFV